MIKKKIQNSHFSEHTLQLECIAWFRNEYERYKKGCIVPVVNELAYKRKDVVIKEGCSDLIVFLPGKVMFFELKVRYNDQQDNQIEFQSLVEGLGYEYYLSKTLHEFQTILLKPPKTEPYINFK
jgi:hypothetical protein